MKYPFLIAVLLALVIALVSIVGSLASQFPLLAPTATATVTPSRTPTMTLTNTPSPTSTPIPTSTSTPTVTLTPTPTQWTCIKGFDPNEHVSWPINCDNDDRSDGYRMPWTWARNYCVPGELTWGSVRYRSPSNFFGLMSSYAAGVMENVIENKGLDPRRVRGVALMSCGDIGRTVWLRRPEIGVWEGPFIAVDCSQRRHMYYHEVGMGLVVEVGYRTASEWGEYVRNRIDVHIGSGPPGAWSGVYYPAWWVYNKMEFEPPTWWEMPFRMFKDKHERE